MIGRSQRRWARASVRARHVLEKLKAGKWSAMPILRKVRRKRTPSRSDGLQAASEDLKWLAQAANGDSAAVPPYNRSAGAHSRDRMEHFVGQDFGPCCWIRRACRKAVRPK